MRISAVGATLGVNEPASNTSISGHCFSLRWQNNKKSKVPSLSINLEERDKERGLYTLSNASQTLKKYYNHFFEAEWNARLINSGVILSIKYEAFLIGECPDSLTTH